MELEGHQRPRKLQVSMDAWLSILQTREPEVAADKRLDLISKG